MTETGNEEKTAAIYCRVSTSEQAEKGYSITEQERLLLEYCDQNNYKVYKVYADKGISGKDIRHRPQMTLLLEEANKKKFNLVITWKINRLSRKLADAIKIVELLEKKGITYRSYSEPFESSTPSGRMQFQMMALVAEFERSTIAQNVKMGMCAKARSGEWCGGIAPLGYDWVPMEEERQGKRKKSKLTVNEKEAETVREIFRLYTEGNGYKAIVNHINKQGFRTKRGNYFGVAQLRDILTNPVYIGKVRYDVRRDWNDKRRNNKNPHPIIEEGIHEAIIDKKTWEKVQYLISQKQGKASRLYDGEYPLTGILRCPECGAGMVISRTTNTLKDGSKRRIVYYACGEWKNKGTAACHSNMIRVEKANHEVYKQLEKLFTDERFLREAVKRVNKNILKQSDEAESSIEKYDRELKKLQARKDKIFEAYEENLITSEELLERKETINQEIQQIQENRERYLSILGQGRSEIPYEYVRNALSNFEQLYSNSTSRELKKQLLHMIISKITINKEREIESIKVILTEEMIQFLNNGGDPPEGSPPSFLSCGKGALLELELVI